MNYGNIKKYDIADGPGVRVSLFVSGCRHHCKECFNVETWDFKYGDKYTKETEDEIIEALSPYYIEGFTLLGGDPFEPENQEALLPLLRRIKSELPNKSIWGYTGYLLDKDLINGGKAYCKQTDEILSYLDVLVDGEFILEQKDITLKWKGSQNQRVIDIPFYLKTSEIKTID